MHMQGLVCLKCYYQLCAVIIYVTIFHMHVVGGLNRGFFAYGLNDTIENDSDDLQGKLFNLSCRNVHIVLFPVLTLDYILQRTME